jgi:hypothetical protein
VLERDLQQPFVMSTNPVWEDLQRTADEIKVQVHLGRMEARDRWRTLEQRRAKLEETIAQSGEEVSEAVSREIADVHAALLHLREELVMNARGDFASGW